nr:uncharacterized protein LOC107279231 isoform X2 [Oryza sativa Japonica Group]
MAGINLSSSCRCSSSQFAINRVIVWPSSSAAATCVYHVRLALMVGRCPNAKGNQTNCHSWGLADERQSMMIDVISYTGSDRSDILERNS